jgi:UDP-GlcNAc:undecaprenyl-phosphate GlcNAc-1-phosphate transferase
MFGLDVNLVYLLAFAAFLVLSVSINRLLLRFSRTLGARQLDNMPRWSTEVKPSVGGIAFFIMFLVGTAVLGVLPEDTASLSSRQLAGLFAATTLAFLMGLADDSYNTKPILKFLGQFTCANILYFTDINIQLGPSDAVNYFFSILWVVGMMNSLNMLDNMDAITTVVSISILIATLVFLFQEGQSYQRSAIIIIAVIAGLIGFLGFNWYPSRIIMGDTGSQFLGVFLAAVSMLYLWTFKADTQEYLQVRQFLIPMLVFIMPLLDTITVFARRIGRGQSPFVGGRDHTTHHLAYLGLRDDAVAAVFAFLSLLSIPLSYLVFQSFDQWSFSYAVMAIGYFVLLFVIFQVLYERGKKRMQALK